MEKSIYKILKKYYINFDDTSAKKLLTCKTEDDIILMFSKIWKKEHGGLFDILEPPETLPFIRDNRIFVTECPSNSTKFHNLYVKKLNNLILQYASNILSLDFSNNGGGKPQVIVDGLLPLFTNKILSYYYDKNQKRHFDIKMINDNQIISISNNNASMKGIDYNKYTSSAGEQAIICLLSLNNVKLFGSRSAGFTTVNKYTQLSNKYGIEVPIGYMGTKDKIFKNGLTKYELNK
jgi:C-terminal processing protease CtpA/Prc